MFTLLTLFIGVLIGVYVRDKVGISVMGYFDKIKALYTIVKARILKS